MIDVKELAKQAGLKFSKDWGECYTGNVQIELFAELVAAAASAKERDACAKLCENAVSNEGYVQAKYCAAAIRARGDKHD